MREQKLVKRIFSMVMALVLVIGMMSVAEVQNAQAADTPVEYKIEVKRFWGAAGNTQLVSEYAGTVAAGTVFTGKVMLNGKETSVNWVTSGQNFFIKTADKNTQILIADTSSIKVTAGSKMVAANGDYITITNDCSYVKDASGNLVPAPEEHKEYQIEVTRFWGAAGNTQLVSAYTGTVDAANGTAFVGTIKYNGKDQEVRWDKSGANFFVKTTAGAQILVADTSSIKVTAGTKMVAENGDYITITNDCSYVKDASGNLVPAPEEHKEYQIEVTRFWGAAGNTNLVSAYTGTVDAANGTAFVGTIKYNGKDQEVRWDKSGANFFVKTAAGAQILVADTSSIKVTAGTKMVAENGDYMTITNDCSYVKDASGNLVPAPEEHKEYQIEVTRFWGAAGNTQLVSAYTGTVDAANGTAFVGTIKYNGKDQEVRWDKSGANFFVKTAAGAQILVADTSSIKVTAGTKMVAENGDYITITNDCSYVKDASGNLVPAPEEVKKVSTTISLYKQELGAFNITNLSEVQAAFAHATTFTGPIAIDGTVRENITWTLSGNCLIVEEIKNAVSKIKVSAGTELVTAAGDKITITDDLVLIRNESGVWVEDRPVTEIETEVTFYRCNETLTAYAFSNEAIKDIKNGVTFSGKLKIDGEEKVINWIKSGNCFVIQKLVDDDSFMRLEVSAGTKLIGSDATIITITNNVKNVKLEGRWMEDYGQTKIEYNDVRISFESFDGRGFYLKAEIVAGPDKGKIIGTEAYGTWLSRSEGVAYLNGTKEMVVNYSPNTDMLYISGSWNLETLTSILFQEGTVLIPYSGAKNKTYMRLANTLELEKEAVYGRWGEKGVIKTPTEFSDVTVSVYNVTGVKVAMTATLTSNSGKTVSEIYGDGACCYGSVTIGDPNQGVYTNDNAIFYISGKQILLMGIKVGLMDSIEIKAGTILWPAASSNSQVPIRILNDVVLTRNADDEWVFDVGGINSGISPKTGDEAPIIIYLGALLVASAGLGGCIYCNRKRRRIKAKQ